MSSVTWPFGWPMWVMLVVFAALCLIIAVGMFGFDADGGVMGFIIFGSFIGFWVWLVGNTIAAGTGSWPYEVHPPPRETSCYAFIDGKQLRCEVQENGSYMLWYVPTPPTQDNQPCLAWINGKQMHCLVRPDGSYELTW